MTYKTRPGDSPAIIARRHGTTVAALLAANPNKPTTIVSDPSGRPKRTWQSLRQNERLNMPAGVGALGDDVGVGDAATDAVNALIAAGGPCLQANVALVCAAQRAIGVTVDGKWGSGSSGAARSRGINAPACSPRPSWWAPVGQGNCPTVASAPAARTSSLDQAAGAAYSTLKSDPNYCASVRRTGTAVNTAVHNFKAAWNAANPSRAVPIGTGNYEVSVATALSSALGGVAVPPGCGATAAPAGAAPTAAQAAVTANQTQQAAQAKTVAAQVDAARGAAPAAVQALTSINPCDQASSGTVYAAQQALGIKADGKYGSGKAAAARALGVNAPTACSPAPMWWGAKGSAQAVAATQTAAAAAPAAVAAAPPAAKAAATVAAATAQADTAATKAAQATTGAQADQAAADAKAAGEAAARAAAAATTQAQKDAADAAAKTAQAALDAAAAKGGTAPGGNQITPPEEKKGVSTGAIVVGALGVAALVGLVAVAATGKKGARGARGTRGARGPKRRAKRGGTKRKKSTRKRR